MSHRYMTRLLLAGAMLGTAALRADAALITFDSRALFNAAAPGLPVETFEAGLVSAGGVTTCTGPLSSGTASACFAADGLLPGVTYASTPVGSMALLGANFPSVGNTSKVLGPNAFADTFNLTFTSASAIGFDVFPGQAPGNVLISLFDLADAPLGIFTIPAPVGGTFFGVISDTELLGRVNVSSLGAVPGEVVDNVAFGTTPIPEPTTLILLGLGLASCAHRLRRRRQVP